VSSIAVWALTLFSAGFFILCDTLSTSWAKGSSRTALAILIVLSPTAYLLFGLLASRVNLAVAGSLVNLMIMLGSVLVGLLYFKERVTGLQWTGIAFGVIAVTLLSLRTPK
jgi:multidrug transporter EmrE-like cation transporter